MSDRMQWQPEILHDVDLADVLPVKLSADQAYELAARRHGVTVAEMRSRSRLRHLHAARVDAWRILRAQGWSLTGIGAAVGRDHTSICVALKERG